MPLTPLSEQYPLPSSRETKLEDFLPCALLTSGDSFAKGILLEMFAWCTLALCARLAYSLMGDVNPTFVIYGLFAVILLFFILLDKARSLRVNTRRTLLTDRRKPVLYLRPFSNPYPVIPRDVALASVLKSVGPLVTVGSPKENPPPAGALRLYFNDDEWQEKVGTLISISELVILQPSYTSSLEWEMITARSVLRPEQLIISLLNWKGRKSESRKSEYDLLNIQLKRIYNINLPEYGWDSYFVYFDHDWQPACATLGGYMALLLYFPSLLMNVIPLFECASTAAIRETIRPLLGRRGIRLSNWRTAFDIVLAYFVSAITVLYLILLLFRLFGRKT